MSEEFKFYEAGVGELLRAAGCTPQSWSSDHVDFLDREGRPVHLRVDTPRWTPDYSGAIYTARKAVVEWLTEQRLKPTPEAVQRASESDRLQNVAHESRRCADKLHALTLSVAALRASQITDKSIRVWRFYDAPAELRALSTHGGDEDWVALIPADGEEPSWAESGTPFGCSSVSRHDLPDGSSVLIGAHA